MISNKLIILCLVLFKTVHIQTLIELSLVNNDLKNVETAIRDTVNDLFENFNIENVKDDRKLKEYSTIHNFFAVTTLQDCDNLQNIARLTQVNSVDNDTQDFIAQINEVLHDEEISNEMSDDSSIYVRSYIDMFISKLRYLKDKYMSDKNTAINADILKYLPDTESLFMDINDDNNTVKSKKILFDSNSRQSSARRIYRGKRTKIKDFPFMASIQFFMKFHCAGSIIKNDLVITSSSCLQIAWNNRFFRENPAFLSVQVGSDFYKSGSGENIAVLEIYFHPSYDPKTLRNNLAILRLIRKINFKRSKRVRKIDFDRNPWQLPKNSGRVTLVGWGAKDDRNVIENVFKNKLSYAELKIYPHSECQDYFSEEVVTHTNFCVGSNARGSGACNLDAGGPGTIENILMGVISFGSSICGVPDSPTVLTKLGHYTDWIETIMEQEVPHYKVKTTKAVPKLLPIKTTKTTKTIPSFNPIMDTSPLPKPSEEILNLDNQLRGGRDEDKLIKQFLEILHRSKKLKEHSKGPNEKVRQQIHFLRTKNENKSYSKNQLRLGRDEDELSNEFLEVLNGSEELKEISKGPNEKARQQINFLRTQNENKSYTKNQLRLGRDEDELFKEFLEVLHGSKELKETSKDPNEKARQQINFLRTQNENKSQLRLGRDEDELFKEFLEVLHGSEELKETSKGPNEKARQQINFQAYNEKETYTASTFKTSSDKLTIAFLRNNSITHGFQPVYNKKHSYIQILKDNVKQLLSRPEKLDKALRNYVVINNYTELMDRIMAVVRAQFLNKKLNIGRQINDIDKNMAMRLTTKVKQQKYILRKMY